MNCRIRLAQFDPTLGNLAANLESHLALIEKAVEDGCDMIVFPELSLTGYFLKDQTAEVALTRDAPEISALLERSARISIAFGFVERRRDGRVFNAVAFVEDGEIVHVHHKVHLVNYGMFEESRDLAGGESFQVFDSKHGRFGILTCEDMWHAGGGYLYFLDGADAILVCSAGPGRGVTASETAEERGELESNRVWQALQQATAMLYRTWILYVNRVGWEDGIIFGGATRAFDPFGQPAGGPLGLDPANLDVTLDTGALRRARNQTPLRRGEKPWILFRALAERFGFEVQAKDAPTSE